jgi:hypothetical protein
MFERGHTFRHDDLSFPHRQIIPHRRKDTNNLRIKSDLRARLEQHIERDPQTGCWNWRGGTAGSGYPKTRDANSKQAYAYRVMYELTRGKIPDEMTIDHLCRNKLCVNPDHLEVVTRAENVRRGQNWQLNKTHCPRGHPYDAVRKAHGGLNRYCTICQRRMEKEHAARKDTH